jgi:uncharacterized repeat protein (TIGR01451 family)
MSGTSRRRSARSGSREWVAGGPRPSGSRHLVLTLALLSFAALLPVAVAYASMDRSHQRASKRSQTGQMASPSPSSLGLGRGLAAAAATPTITEYSLAAFPNASPQDITAGPDGNLWFTDPYATAIGRITTSGSVDEHPVATDGQLGGITTGRDERIWFTFFGAENGIGVIDPFTSVATLFHCFCSPQRIAVGLGGDLWVTDANGDGAIDHFDIQGNLLNVFPLAGIRSSTPGCPVDTSNNPDGIALGPDGNVWFSETGTGRIGQISESGNVVQFSVAAPDACGVPRGDPGAISLGPDGNLWFTQQGSPSSIGKMTTSGVVMLYPLSPDSLLSSVGNDIASGPQGSALLYVADELGAIESINASTGEITRYAVANPANSQPDPVGIALGSDNNMWFTDQTSPPGFIGKFAPGFQPPPPMPVLSIAKTADNSEVTARKSIGFTIDVSNVGNADAANVTVSDVMPTNPGLTWSVASVTPLFAGSPTPTNCTITTGSLDCDAVGTLPASEGFKIHVISPTTEKTANSDAGSGKGVVSNSATASASNANSVGPASAQVQVTLPPPSPPPPTGTCVPPEGATCSPLSYGGGSVMLSDTNYLIFWDPQHQFSSTFVNLVERYFNDVGGSGLYDVLAQYWQIQNGRKHYIQNQSHFGGAVLDSSPFNQTCTDPTTGNQCVSQGEIETEIRHAMSAEGWRGGLDHMFFVLLAPGEGACGNFFFFTYGCAGTAWCAEHDYFSTLPLGLGDKVIYAIVPDYQTFPSCISSRAPNFIASWDSELSGISHEQSEAVTDPLGDGWKGPGSNDEIGDKCNYNYTAGSTAFAGQGLPYAADPNDPTFHNANELWKFHFYEVQSEWDNFAPIQPDGSHCITTLYPYAPLPIVAATTAHGDVTVRWNPPDPQSPSGARTIRYVVTPEWSNGEGIPRNVSGNANSVTFHHLSSGSYKFVVVAVNKYGSQAALSNAVTIG